MAVADTGVLVAGALCLALGLVLVVGAQSARFQALVDAAPGIGTSFARTLTIVAGVMAALGGAYLVLDGTNSGDSIAAGRSELSSASITTSGEASGLGSSAGSERDPAATGADDPSTGEPGRAGSEAPTEATTPNPVAQTASASAEREARTSTTTNTTRTTATTGTTATETTPEPASPPADPAFQLSGMSCQPASSSPGGTIVMEIAYHVVGGPYVTSFTAFLDTPVGQLYDYPSNVNGQYLQSGHGATYINFDVPSDAPAGTHQLTGMVYNGVEAGMGNVVAIDGCAVQVGPMG